jgi:UDP-N-acetylmuramyl pentapeptide phosphotransferase/UDP-N-acetylglucosamine-1-phosphate transferase
MKNFLILSILTIIFLCFNFFCTRYNFFVDKVANSSHKKFILHTDRIPLTGGFYLLIGYISSQVYIYNFSEIYFFSTILLLGYFSDMIKNFSTYFRLLFQVIICFLFLIYFNLSINDVRIEYINNFLNKDIFAYSFTVFCIVVLINGSNFIDGVNILSLGYYLLILISLGFLANNYPLLLNRDLIKILILLVAVIILLNGFNKVFLGDGGIYFLSFVVAIILIKFKNDNLLVSPYYIICLLWYPCFENLFSIIRRIIVKLNPQEPDNMHLHHLLYKYLNKKNLKICSSNLSGIVIIVFNIPIFLLSNYYYYYTKYLLFIILLATILYIFSYYLLRKINK